jgi:HD-GYP domain-containing protein (c-di-GMP phosphodiesterase class II)
VADCFDAMTSPRRYRAPKSAQEATEEICTLAGTQFDPVVVDAFMKLTERHGDDLTNLPSQESIHMAPDAGGAADQPKAQPAGTAPDAPA